MSRQRQRIETAAMRPLGIGCLRVAYAVHDGEVEVRGVFVVQVPEIRPGTSR